MTQRCPVCDGKGTISSRHDKSTWNVKCPQCGGSGQGYDPRLTKN